MALPTGMHISAAAWLQAFAAADFSQITSAEDLEHALARAAAGDRLLLLMAGTTWCKTSRAVVQDVKVSWPAGWVLPSSNVCAVQVSV